VIGLTLGHYRILEKLGDGGMGVVYRAEDVRLGREVAVKVLPEQLRDDPVALERFNREARAAAALNHPAICIIHDVGHDQGYAFIAMELLEGRTLKQMIEHQPMPVADVLQYGVQIAEALEAAHAKNVIHRDLKPANIFITARGQAKVLDFGVAKVLEPAAAGGADTVAHESGMTRPGAILGTVSYMSPEQVRGDFVDARSDIFAFGIVLYEMATGEHPFTGPTSGAIFDSILHGKPRPPAELNPSVSTALEKIILKALEKDRGRRFFSAAAMHAALEDLRSHRSGPHTTAATAMPVAVRIKPRRNTGVPSTSGRTRGIASLAVLPFANAGGDPDAEYLSDGMTESIIYSLTHLPGLRVVPRTTVFRYKGSDKDLAAIARELKVKAIVTGRVSLRAGQLIVQAELVDAARDAQLWGERYTRQFADVFAVQEEMATAISSSLQLRLSGEDRARLAVRPTRDSEAYEAYLKGRHYWNKRTLPAFARATEYFQEAINRDQQFVLAYAGLADTFNVLGYYNARPPKSVYPLAKAAAARALELDATLAEAHASLGYATLFYDRDFPAAERHFRAALSHNPKYASAHQWYGWYLLVVEQFSDMVGEMEQAHMLDPLSLIINDHLGYALSLAGRHHEAIAQLQRTLELDPQFSLTRLRLGLELRLMGRNEEGLQQIESAAELSSGRIALGYLGQAYAEDGRMREARELLDRMTATGGGQYVSPLDRALVHDGLGEPDAVFASLEEALDERISDMVRLRVLAWSPTVRRDPRFSALCLRVGLSGAP
jgi:eukaryotic-like serine/threonine-protein kinase